MTSDAQLSQTILITGIITYIVVFIFYAIPAYVIYWKLFKKAGRKGWEYLIPVYGQYIEGVIADSPKLGLTIGIMWAIYLVLGFIPAIAPFVGVLGIIWAIAGLVLLRKFVMKYDAGVGKWMLFIFLPIVGMFQVNDVNYKGHANSQTPLAPKNPDQTPTSVSETPVTPASLDAAPESEPSKSIAEETPTTPLSAPVPAPIAEQAPAQNSDTTPPASTPHV